MKLTKSLAAVALISSWLGAGAVRADAASDKAASVALFNEGRRLVGLGKLAEACPKFEASFSLVPGIGTQLNLADCYQQLGRTASAWATFRDAAIAAARSLVDWRNLKLDPNAGTARLTSAGMRLDLGGIGKGYAAQEAVDLLIARGYPSCLVALAGDVAVGAAPPGEPGWRVAVTGEQAGPEILDRIFSRFCIGK